MYEIKAATVLQDTDKVSFLPNVKAGEDVIILGENSVESGVYTRKRRLENWNAPCLLVSD